MFKGQPYRKYIYSFLVKFITLFVIKTIVYYLLGVLGIATVFGLGLFGGYFVSIIDATPIPTEAAMKATLSNTSRTSSMYFAHNVKLSNVKSDLVLLYMYLNTSSNVPSLSCLT